MKILISITILGITLFTSSCSTCTTCTYDTKDGEEISEEYCGKSEDVTNFKGEMEEEAIKNRSTYNCIDSH